MKSACTASLKASSCEAATAVEGMPRATSMAIVGPERTASRCVPQTSRMTCVMRMSDVTSMPLTTLTTAHDGGTKSLVRLKTDLRYSEGTATTITSADIKTSGRDVTTIPLGSTTPFK